jgi:hypothetical protein
MQAQALLEKPKSVPFTLSFVEGIDQKMYDKATSESAAIKESYDPETQTSNIDIYAGTALTYTDSMTGTFIGIKDDVNQADT